MASGDLTLAYMRQLKLRAIEKALAAGDMGELYKMGLQADEIAKLRSEPGLIDQARQRDQDIIDRETIQVMNKQADTAAKASQNFAEALRNLGEQLRKGAKS